MSGLLDCCSPCPTVQTVNVPGSQGDAGAAGADGTNGVNAFTTTTADFLIPAINSNVTVTVGNSTWMVVGQNIFIEEPANFEVVSIPGPSSVELKFLGYTGDAAPGATVSAGAGVSPGGLEGPSSVGALPNAITDNSTGTASDTIAAGAGVHTVAFYIDAADLANGDILTDYTPGYRFKILKFDARCAKVVSTGAKQATLNLEIDSTNLTGGVISLAGTYALGAAQNGSAVTGNNVGTALQSISIEASSVTAFIEGAFWLILSIQNMDTADAIASLADHINDLITAL